MFNKALEVMLYECFRGNLHRSEGAWAGQLRVPFSLVVQERRRILLKGHPQGAPLSAPHTVTRNE
jgi:hypothetical protein